MNFRIILAQSMLWSILWIIMVAISIRVFPFTIEHDYPDDVRKIANIPQPSKKHRRNEILFATISFVILFGLLITFAVSQYIGRDLSFGVIFFHLWLVSMSWNIVDLVIVDWLLICMLSVKYFVLPGTERCPSNRNYRFHFIGFLKGFVTMSIISFLLTLISYSILWLLK